MFWLKSCSRCGGDLFSDRDKHGPYTSCLQCGRYLTEAEETQLKHPVLQSARMATRPVVAPLKEEEKVAA